MKKTLGPDIPENPLGFLFFQMFFRFPEVFWFLCNPSSRWKHHPDPKEQKTKTTKISSLWRKSWAQTFWIVFWFFWFSSGVFVFFAVLVLVADGGFRIQKQKTAIRQRDKKTKASEESPGPRHSWFFCWNVLWVFLGRLLFFAILVVDEGFQIQKTKKNCYKNKTSDKCPGSRHSILRVLKFWGVLGFPEMFFVCFQS